MKSDSRLDEIYRNSLQYFGLIMALLPSDVRQEILPSFYKKRLEIPNDIKEKLKLNDYLNSQLKDSSYSLIKNHTGITKFVQSGNTITAHVERNGKKYEIVVIQITEPTEPTIQEILYEDITNREEKEQKKLYGQLAAEFERCIDDKSKKGSKDDTSKDDTSIVDFIESYTDCSYDFTKYTINTVVLQGNSVLPIYNKMNCAFLDLRNIIKYDPIINHNKNKLKSLKVYSGNNLIYSRGGVAALALVGESVHLFTSMSTSVQLTIALAFTLEKMCPVIYEITIPDTLWSYVFPVEKFTANDGEFEVILPLSSKLLIESFEIKNYSVIDGDEKQYYDILTLNATLMQPDPDIIELYKNVFTCGDANVMRGGGDCRWENRWIDVDFGNGSFLTTKELEMLKKDIKELEMLKTDIKTKLKKSPKTAITKRTSPPRTVTKKPVVKRLKRKHNDEDESRRMTLLLSH